VAPEVPPSDYYTIAIMAESPLDNNEMITSFSNPNYTLNDAVNSNIPSQSLVTPTQYYDDNGHIYDDINDVTSTSDGTNTSSMGKSRKKYAQVDLKGMGLGGGMSRDTSAQSIPDSCTTPLSDGATEPETPGDRTDNIVDIEHSGGETEDETGTHTSKGFLGYYASLEKSARSRQASEEKQLLKPEKKAQSKSFEDKTKDINSPDSNDSGIQADVPHIHGPVNDDIYAVVNRNKKAPKPQKSQDQAAAADKDEDTEDEPPLAPGWEKHQDEDGAYYWHIKSGTIQREPPPPAPPQTDDDHEKTPLLGDEKPDVVPEVKKEIPKPPPKKEEPAKVHTAAKEEPREPPVAQGRECPEGGDKEVAPIRFAVRSLGWVRIAEEDLTPERSSKAVNKCIVDLSLGRNDINDVVGRWGDGKDLFMDLDSRNLTLIDPQDFSVLNIQPIHSIRVWGVGRDNGRDFAYVARDRMTRKHMCHVFRCDTPARQIANTLRDICKKIMLERSLREGMQQPKIGISRPTNLPNLIKDGQANGQKLSFDNTSFPTPMEEPKKVLRCHYLGTAQVARPTGVEVLNSAMEKVYSRVPPEKWVFTSVAVAPSTITITEHGNADNVLAECRVRFLSFMGIAMRNVKLCSFIMHTAQDHYVAHVFHCEPSGGAMCKTIEAACKLRFQKCLDANSTQHDDQKKQANQQKPENTVVAIPPPTKLQATQQTLNSTMTTLRTGVQSMFTMIKKKATTTPKT